MNCSEINKNPLFFLLLIILCFSAITTDTTCQSCPKKIKWKKLRTEEQVKTILYRCLPEKSSKSEITTFLSEKKIKYEEIAEENVIFFSVLIQSVSVWIEKKWAIRMNFDENNNLKGIEAEQWLTAP